ncbi:MAG: oligosaccharide flippase family protein [Candidatus Thorarchaeota archaeon]
MEDKSELTILAGGTFLTLIGMVIALALEFFIRVISARVLNTAEFGTLFLGLKILNIAIFVAILGMDNGATTQISYSYAKGNLTDVGSKIGTTLLITFLTACVSSVSLWLLSDTIAIIFSIPELGIVLKILSIGLLPILAVRIFTAIFRGLKKFKPKVIFEDSLFFGLRILSVLGVVYLIVTLEMISLAISLAALLGAIIYFVYFKGSITVQLSISKDTSKSLLLFSLPLALQMLTYQLMTGADSLIVGLFATASIVGLYGTTVILSQFIPIGTQAVYFAFLPAATGLYANNKMESLKQTYLAASKWGLIISLIIFIGLESFPRTALSIFGSNYAVAFPWLEILAIGYLIHSIIGLSGPTLVAIGKPRITAAAWATSAVAALIVAYFLVPIYGPIGAAIAVSIAFFLVNFIHLAFLWIEIKLKPIGQGSIRALIIAFCVIIFTRFVVPEPANGFGLVDILMIALLPIGLFLVCILIFGVISKEDMLFLDLVERSIGRDLGIFRRIIQHFVKKESESAIM